MQKESGKNSANKGETWRWQGSDEKPALSGSEEDMPEHACPWARSWAKNEVGGIGRQGSPEETRSSGRLSLTGRRASPNASRWEEARSEQLGGFVLSWREAIGSICFLHEVGATVGGKSGRWEGVIQDLAAQSGVDRPEALARAGGWLDRQDPQLHQDP